MSIREILFLLAGTVLLTLSSCRTGGKEDSWGELLQESDRLAALQEWEPATEYALKALSACKTAGSRSLALSRLASLDIMTWRDAQGWEHAVEAERLARLDGTDSLISAALLQKGRLQLCGAITEGEAQDADALETLQEALSFAASTPGLQADILLQISQAYIGLNRFSSPVDPQIYAKAGEAINRAVSVSTDPSFPSRALPYWMRWYRQGGNWKDGIACCEKVLEGLKEDDHLMRSQCWNNLVMLYAQSGDVENTARAHQQYVYAMEYYMQQKADARLQEMETRYETSLKEARIARMRIWVLMLCILAAALVALVLLSLAYIRRIKASDRGKEQLLRLVSKDFTSPQFNRKVSESLRELSSLEDEAAVRDRCKELFGDEDGFIAEDVASYIVNLLEERSREVKKLGLTARELEVIRLSREGLSASEIADRLHVSVYTIKNHKQNIYLKMDVRSNAEMLSKANQLGLS
ncbi:MAG: response regulator transcription factor [Bacteroidales bacterium]|jgi:DNA-binding CsgD family transcriptional regulator|nr:response regulator transcription factor [Bacteroidales bacterium]